MTVKAGYVVELHAVSKRYGETAVVDGIDLQVSAGECFVLIGHNGAGKTTLMKLMLGLTFSDVGEVRILGENPSNRSFAVMRQDLGYLPESVSFYPHMKGLELLKYYARLKNLPVIEAELRLDQVGLSKAANRRLSTYSKGMRQRLGLAQALLGVPRLLFLDEPTTGLDPLSRHDFYQIISDLRARGTTVIISSHALNEIEAQADRVAIIKQGRLEACGSLQELGRMLSLPVSIHVNVAPDSADSFTDQIDANISIDRVDGHSFDLLCDESEKMKLLRHITGLGEMILDVSISTPHLDEIYLHYMKGEPDE